jgi:hypothetical protein
MDSNINNTNNPPAPPNPPSIEAAYKRKCIELKKRLNEIEAANEAMRLRNEQGRRYIQKMRLESCILLERLSVLTGMTEEHGSNPELRARAAALMKDAGSIYAETGAEAATGNSGTIKRGSYGLDYLDDGTEGSSDEQPPPVRFLTKLPSADRWQFVLVVC